MVALKLYNTLTRSKEVFRPLDPANVRMYVCGPTVYDYAHIGNARPVIVFDVLFRLLRHLAKSGAFDGGRGETNVTYVRNITDIDDKINKRAFERWSRKRPLLAEMRDLTEGTAAQFKADVTALGCLPPTHEPRATDFVCDGAKPIDMVRVIERLVERGVAYAAEGHVLFSPKAMDALADVPDYGRLSRRSLDEMIAGARVDVAPYKRDPMDFVLWKPSDRDTEPGWDSPWGFGRPGWHIECSAMSAALLGQTFDIHGGGIDLIFPHHENEIAQSCCAFGLTQMASVWMHNGFLQVEGQKMSKSLGNFVTIDELLSTTKFGGRTWPGEVVRLAMLKTHYRQPIDWTVRALEEAEANLARLHAGVQDFAPSEPCPMFLNGLLDDVNFKVSLDRLFDLMALAEGEDLNAGGMLHASLQLVGLAPQSTPRTGIGYGVDKAGNVEFLPDFWEGVRRFVPRNAWAKNTRQRFVNAASDGSVHAEVASAIIDSLRYLDDRAPVEDVWSDHTRAALVVRRIEERLSVRRAAATATGDDKKRLFAESDRIRDELAAMGIQLKDGKDPVTGELTTTWEVKR